MEEQTLVMTAIISLVSFIGCSIFTAVSVEAGKSSVLKDILAVAAFLSLAVFIVSLITIAII